MRNLLPFAAIVLFFPLSVNLNKPKYVNVRRAALTAGCVSFAAYAVAEPARRFYTVSLVVLFGAVLIRSFSTTPAKGGP